MVMRRQTPLVFLAVTVASVGLNAGNVATSADRFGYCGAVMAYTPPGQTQEGSVTVGTRTFRISAGLTIGGTDPIAVGTKRCVAGDRDASDRFTSLSAEATLLESTCGTVSQFTRATAAVPGSLVLNDFRFVMVREGTELSSGSASGHRCFALTMAASGDAMITGTTDLPPGQAAAPTATLPSTSTGEIDSQIPRPQLQ
jgi:hypothetical protein